MNRMTILTCVMLLALLPSAPTQQLLAVNVVRVFGDEDSDNRLVFAEPVQLPPNVSIARAYAEAVQGMLRSSPTFRSQCTRIARAPHLYLSVERSVLAPRQSAVTHMVRASDGRLFANVEVNPLGDEVVLIAHEFEHVIEQLDDVDLAAMASRVGTGVRTDPQSGRFETERAIAVGRRVASEVHHAVARR
jgi:hypothetical protein